MKLQERLLQRFGRCYPKGKNIFQEGDIGQDVYYILSGQVQIEKGTGKLKKILTTLAPGEYFGEMSAIIPSPRTATAYTLDDSYIAVIGRETFQALLRNSGEVSFLILQESARRLKTTSDLLDQASQSLTRLKALLFLLSDEGAGPEGPVLERLAAYLHKDPQETAAILEWLDSEGVIELKDGRIDSLDEHALRRLAADL
jgi:CRP/FNR family cyclic AMP-dependent transcriptional regulator